MVQTDYCITTIIKKQITIIISLFDKIFLLKLNNFK